VFKFDGRYGFAPSLLKGGEAMNIFDLFELIWKAAKLLAAVIKIAEYIEKRTKTKHRP